MEIIEDKSKLNNIAPGGVLTIGNFDGVHKGHREIIRRAREISDKQEVEIIAMTFEPHPVAVLFPEKAPSVLTPLEYKASLLEDCGVDKLVVLRDSRELLDLSPKEFVEEFLMENLQPSVVVEGDDFNFGTHRSGSIETLIELSNKNGFDVEIVESLVQRLSTGQSVRVSSTIIRYMLESGHIGDARAALGRNYRLLGKVVRGRGKGRELGFPTANIGELGQIVPAEGVYAGRVCPGEEFGDLLKAQCSRPAVYSIGQARTYGDQYPLLIEAHLLDDPEQELVGKWMAMDYVEYIRKQHKFNSEKELSEQIAKDCREARQILKSQKI